MNLALIAPEYPLIERLSKLGKRRNNLIHNLFYKFTSIDDLRVELKQFCRDAVKLNIEQKRYLDDIQIKER
jgi:intein-encoded DNA endonuclease-like protein